MNRPVVVVVDDDSQTLASLGRMLSAESYRTYLISGGPGAAMALTIAKPDLVILDTRSPEAGWEILETLRRNSDLAHVPVILCSGDATVLRAGLLQDCRCGVLEKPFSSDELLALVAETIRSVDLPGARARNGRQVEAARQYTG